MGRKPSGNKKPGIVGRNLRHFRQAREWSQEHLAELAGVSRLTITYLENGDSQTADSDTVRALAKALGLRPGDLLEEPDEAFGIDQVLAEFQKSPWGQAAKPTAEELTWLRSLSGHFWVGLTGGQPSPKAMFQLLEAYRRRSDL